MRQLSSAPGLWSTFVPVVWHVDYWDGLGWPDRFASKDFTERQRRLVSFWPKPSVYTPGVVLDGEEWKAWRLRGQVPKRAANAPGLGGVLGLRLTADQRLTIEFEPAPESALDDLVVEVVPLAMGLETEVTRGENRGQTLRHDFVALGRLTARMQREGAIPRATFEIRPSAVAGVDAIAAWVHLPDRELPLQVLGATLREPLKVEPALSGEATDAPQ